MSVIYRNSLLKGIHNFIHLNLTIALALALLVFVTGIETATGNEVSQTSNLHYEVYLVYSYNVMVKKFSTNASLLYFNYHLGLFFRKSI